ncbi:hypothetical protein Sjap_015495 [Stephania japonica]|uniref:Uncharacterized protein n=1 Tax=Stephania japonica TaxID=461633 RepID=A0AAP0IJD3_9MAGN
MNRLPEAQQLISTNPNPNPTPSSFSIDPPLFYTQHCPFYSEIPPSLSATTAATQIHHIIPYSTSSSYSEMALRPPGIDPVYHPHALAVGAIEAHATAAAAPYYQDHQQSSVAVDDWTTKEGIRQYGVYPYGYPAPIHDVKDGFQICKRDIRGMEKILWRFDRLMEKFDSQQVSSPPPDDISHDEGDRKMKPLVVPI